ncbi:MAG: addiction module protein [Bacteroidetes bacterium]|nr:addiction module protein [Bacteroidota bacterium]MCH8525347.1 addiction module protein [Balneolales bacterium]
MANLFNEIESSALKLPIKQRARLASKLIRSLEKHDEKQVEKLWLEEIDRRNENLEKGNAELVSESDVMKNVRSILS